MVDAVIRKGDKGMLFNRKTSCYEIYENVIADVETGEWLQAKFLKNVEFKEALNYVLGVVA